jgi:phospholipid-translocating ATPase
VRITLENIKNAGVKVWMLTGDKLETAICISISSGLKTQDNEIFIIKELQTLEELL